MKPGTRLSSSELSIDRAQGRIWVGVPLPICSTQTCSVTSCSWERPSRQKTFAAAEMLKARTLLDAIHSKPGSGIPFEWRASCRTPCWVSMLPGLVPMICSWARCDW